LKKQYLKYLPKSSRDTLKNYAALDIPLSREQVDEFCRSEVQDLAMEIGLLGAISFLEQEVDQLCGAWHERRVKREMTRYGAQPGWVMVGGQKLAIPRPRVRYVHGGEVRLSRYERLQRRQAVGAAVLRRVIRGVSCRNYEEVVDEFRRSCGAKKSAVSRKFITEMAGRIKEVSERRWDGVHFVAIFIDGKVYGQETIIVALGVAVDGTKHILALRQGATENSEVCKDLLEDLASRGVATGRVTLFVLDGSKALAGAVRRVWGRCAVIARCQVHKRRNLKKHLPCAYWAELDRRLDEAWYGNDYERSLEQLKATAVWLDRINPDAGRSLREGMEETLTVVRLGIPELLRQSLSSTNLIESAFSVADTVGERVKQWKAGDMRWRWCAAGLLFAESKFHRVSGYRFIPALIAALDAIAQKDGLETKSEVA
jgi:transposase-like protein